MNITNNINLTNFTITNTNMDIGIYYKDVCEQLNHYFVTTGLILICLYVFICWFNWWFFNYGFKKIDYFKEIDYNKSSEIRKFIGDLNNLETRAYWDIYIKSKLMKLLVGYIVIVVYLNL